jgi:hypothetical protein
MVLFSRHFLSRVTSPDSKAMHSPLSTRLTHAAVNAARPARRHIVRALRHHSARTRALAEQWRDAKPVDSVRVWFRTFFAALRVQGASRRLSLRTLLRNPSSVRMLSAPRVAAVTDAPVHTSRRPRRVSATSEGWFAFPSR